MIRILTKNKLNSIIQKARKETYEYWYNDYINKLNRKDNEIIRLQKEINKFSNYIKESGLN